MAEIREYCDGDEAALIELWTRCGLVKPWNDPAKDIARKLRVDPDLLLVMTQAEKIIGSVMGGYEGHRGWINYLAVCPDHQRAGHGRALMAEVERRIAERGCPKINLQVRAGNSEVLAFYAALGYADDRVIGLGKRLVSDE